MSPSRVIGDGRNMPRPGSLGGDPASAMARPTMGQPLPAVNQRTQVAAGVASAGTFQLRLRARGNTLDVTTAAINFNDSLANVVAKIDAVLNPLGLDATGVSGGPLPAATVVEFPGGEAFTVTVVNSTLVGDVATITTPQAATGFVLPAGPSRTPGNNRPSAMARPRPLGRGGA